MAYQGPRLLEHLLSCIERGRCKYNGGPHRAFIGMCLHMAALLDFVCSHILVDAAGWTARLSQEKDGYGRRSSAANFIDASCSRSKSANCFQFIICSSNILKRRFCQNSLPFDIILVIVALLKRVAHTTFSLLTFELLPYPCLGLRL